jgi:hypothetical protein
LRRRATKIVGTEIVKEVPAPGEAPAFGEQLDWLHRTRRKLMSRPEKFDALAVRQRKREMVDRAAALYFPNYDASGAELIIGAERFVAPKALEVQLDDGWAGNASLQATR